MVIVISPVCGSTQTGLFIIAYDIQWLSDSGFLFLPGEAFNLFCNQFRIVEIVDLHCLLYIR